MKMFGPLQLLRIFYADRDFEVDYENDRNNVVVSIATN